MLFKLITTFFSLTDHKAVSTYMHCSTTNLYLKIMKGNFFSLQAHILYTVLNKDTHNTQCSVQ